MTNNSSTTILNDDSRNDDDADEVMNYPIIAVLFVSVIIGISGNLTIVIVRIFKQLQRKNTTAYTFLVCQLAIADLIFAFTMTFDIYIYIKKEWVFGVGVCRFVKVIQSASLTTTIGFLTVMAYERFCGISKPLQHRWSIRKTFIIVLTMWVYVFLTFIPFVIALDVKPGLDNKLACYEVNYSASFRKGYTLFLFITNFLAPLISISIFHTLIVSHMKKHLKSMRDQRHRSSPSIKRKIKNNVKQSEGGRGRMRQTSTTSTYSLPAEDAVCGEGETNCWVALYKLLRRRFDKNNNNHSNGSYQTSPILPPSAASQSRRRSTNVFRRLISRSKTNEDRKLVKMLVAVTMSFAIMALPPQIYYIWIDWIDSTSPDLKFMEVLSSLVYLHCCSNCIIYSVMDKKFRTDVRKTIEYIFNCTPKTSRLRESLQRVTVVSRLSRSSRHYSSSTTMTTTSSTSTTKAGTSSSSHSENLIRKEDITATAEDQVFLTEKETVIL